MDTYAHFYGEWSDYHESYKWQPLNGGHRALGDCYKAYDLLLEMALTNRQQIPAQTRAVKPP